MKKEVIIFIILFFIMLVNAADQQGTIVVNVLESECKLDFKQGWNLFSFCSNLNNPNLVNVLSQIDGKYRYIMKWNINEQSFNIYSPKAMQNPFVNFDDNSSYFIYMYEVASLDVSGQEAGI